jgi:RNA polymerase-interacting CarD/CdnL/TRCF family regulator
MPSHPLDLYQLLEKFRDTLFKVVVSKPSEVEARKVVLRNLLKQNLVGIKKQLLEQELRRDQQYKELCQMGELKL